MKKFLLSLVSLFMLTLFAQAGDFMSAGIAVGIDDGSSDVQNAIKDMSGDTFKKLTGALVANKAFFGTNEELSNSLDLVFDGDPTAVEAIAEANAANAEAPVKVIKNGQLYIGNYNVAGARIK